MGEGDPQATAEPLFSFPVWISLYALSGFIALSLEIVWFRLLGVDPQVDLLHVRAPCSRST